MDTPSHPRDLRRTALHCRVRRTRGFSLIEILVVVAIAAVMAYVLVIAVSGNTARQLDATVERFQQRLAHACDQAQLSGREFGVRLGVDGYAFARLDGSQWRALGGNDELRARRWPPSLRVVLKREGLTLDLQDTAAEVPHLVCFSSGELTPFVLDFALGDPPMQRRLVGSADGSLRSVDQ